MTFNSRAILALLLFTCFTAFILPASAEELRVRSGAPAQVKVTVPAKVYAGEPFALTLEVRDRFGNIVPDYNLEGRGFQLDVDGSGKLAPSFVPATAFKQGMAVVPVAYNLAERIVIQIREDKGSAAYGQSVPFFVLSGRVADLQVVVPPSSKAGLPFRIKVVARDSVGNVVKDFASRTEGVVLASGGIGVMNPSRILPEEFHDGVAEIAVMYTVAENIPITAKDITSGISGTSADRVQVRAGDPASFKITSPKKAYVDMGFNIAITSLDAFDNIVDHFNQIGTVVALQTSGSGEILPREIPARDFVAGVAFVSARYSRAENISIIATEVGSSRTGVSELVEIIPGVASGFHIDGPRVAQAGEPFKLRITAIDAKGNSSDQLPKDMTDPVLSILGTIATTPITLSAAEISHAVSRDLTYTVAEEIVVTVQTRDGGMRSEPFRIQVRPGLVESIGIGASQVGAGAAIPVRLTAWDAYRNVVTDFDRSGKMVRVTVQGSEQVPAVAVPAASFRQGQAVAQLNYFVAETVRIAADVDGAQSLSDPVRILPGDLHHFDMTTPASARAGEPFDIIVSCKDAYGNIVENYGQTGTGVRLRASGAGDIQPADVSASQFASGVAKVQITYYVSEMLTLSAVERFGSAAGTSSNIQIEAGPISHYLLSAPRYVKAGDAFPLRVEAQDMYYNIIKNYNVSGQVVQLKTTGSTILLPAKLMTNDFVGGVATVNVIYTKAEPIEISAANAEGQVMGRSNRVDVVSGEPVKYNTEVLDELVAGEPFRVRITAVDAYDNFVDLQQKSEHLISLSNSGSEKILPAVLTPAVFTGGRAEAFLVYPKAERISIQVKDMLMGADATPEVAGVYFKVANDRTHIYIIASGPLEYRKADLESLETLVLNLPAAVTPRTWGFDNMQMPGVKSVKLSATSSSPDARGRAPRLMVKMDQRYTSDVMSRANMLEIVIRPSMTPQPGLTSSLAPVFDIPTLSEIRGMIEQGDYRRARRAIELFINVNPANMDGIAIRDRLDKVLSVLGAK